MSLNNEQCKARLTLVDLNPVNLHRQIECVYD